MANATKFLLLCWLFSCVYAEEPLQSTTGVMDAFADLPPADQAKVQAAIDRVKLEHQVIFPSGDVNADLYKQVQAERTKDNLMWLERMEAFGGANPNSQAASVDLGGGFTVSGSSVQSPRHMRDSRFLGSASTFDIITSNKNILDDENKRLNKIANRIEKSKFACGNFDWVVQLKTNFNKAALEKYVENLASSALAAAPMALLANLSPTLYEIVKWLRMNASMDLNTEKMKCEDLEKAFTDTGRRMTRGDGYASCMKANSNIGISDAHRICNSATPSPFDGIETTAGQIQGLNASAPNINLTQMLADDMRPAPGEGAASDAIINQKALDDASKSLAAWTADLAAHPDPGPRPTGAEQSGPVIAWQDASRKHQVAKANVATYTKDVQEATKNIGNQGTGIWSTLRNAVADNLGNIIGNIDLSAKANLQFGRQRQYQLILKYKHQAYLHSLEFCTQLETHFKILMAPTRDRDEAAQSYQNLQAFCFGSLKNPWLDMVPVYQLDDKNSSLTVRMSYNTLDKLSVLWTYYKQGDKDSLARTVWADTYRPIEAINAISEYELYDYLLDHAVQDKDTLLEAVRRIQGPTVDQIYQSISRDMDEYIKLLTRKRTEIIPILCQTIHAVNQFKFERGAPVLQGNTPAIPLFPVDEIGR